MIDQDVIDAMKAAGIPAEQILSVVEDALRRDADMRAGRREADRIRKRRERAAEREARTMVASVVSGGQTRTASDTQDNPPSPQESPHTPKEFPPSTQKEKTPKGVQKKGSRLPVDFEPDLDFATGLGLTASQAEGEGAKFRDYWTAKTGQGATKQDWQATWRNWARTAAERLPRQRAGPALRPINPTLAAALRLKDEIDAVTTSEIEGNHSAPRLVAIGGRSG